MCVCMGNPQRGLCSFFYYRSRAMRNKGLPVKSMNIYNTLLTGFAAKSNLGKVFYNKHICILYI